jgi:hypothetical protein
MMACGGAAYSFTALITLVLDGGQWSASRSDRFTPPESVIHIQVLRNTIFTVHISNIDSLH